MLFVHAHVQIEKEYKKNNRRIHVKTNRRTWDYRKGTRLQELRIKREELYIVQCTFQPCCDDVHEGYTRKWVGNSKADISTMKQEYMQDNRSTGEMEYWSYGVQYIRLGVKQYTGVQEYMSTWVYDYRSTGVQEFRSTGVQEYRSTRVQEYKSTRVQEYRSTRVQEYRSKDIQECRSTGVGVQKYRSTGVQESRE